MGLTMRLTMPNYGLTRAYRWSYARTPMAAEHNVASIWNATTRSRNRRECHWPKELANDSVCLIWTEVSSNCLVNVNSGGTIVSTPHRLELDSGKTSCSNAPALQTNSASRFSRPGDLLSGTGYGHLYHLRTPARVRIDCQLLPAQRTRAVPNYVSRRVAF